MLVIEISSIPGEGLEVHEDLKPGEVHLEGDESFALLEGGRLDCRLDRGDDQSVHVRGPRVGPARDLGIRSSFADLGATLAENFGVGPLGAGTSFLDQL